MATVLITQCLQRDFVDPIGPHDPLPNLLHVGYSEAAGIVRATRNPNEERSTEWGWRSRAAQRANRAGK